MGSIGGLIGLVLAAWGAYWVYNDAKKNRIDPAALYAALTFFSLLIGLAVYLIVRARKR